ncbi:MAG: hypothetical protein O2816_07490 [Planctomycetota bacterium]|nr:hypothetical protein [Planctomycetota bacterium]
MIRALQALLVLPLVSSCIIHVEADGHDSDLAYALHAWKSPALRELADDLDDAGWEIKDMDRKGNRTWKLELESHDGRQDATLRVELGNGRNYKIRQLDFDAQEGANLDAQNALRSLVDPEEIELLEIETI